MTWDLHGYSSVTGGTSVLVRSSLYKFSLVPSAQREAVFSRSFKNVSGGKYQSDCLHFGT